MEDAGEGMNEASTGLPRRQKTARGRSFLVDNS
jgi:hypothetical protein